MNSLKKILGLYANPTILGGDGELAKEDIEKLKEHLKNRRRTNLLIIAGCALLIIAGLVYIISSSADAEKLEKTIGKSSVVGISIAGIFGFILNLWKEISYIRLLLIFINSMDADTLKSIIAETWSKI
jgi:hypothetical protein